jgi:hypothetical protein
MLYYCKQEAPVSVWKGSDGHDLYTRVGFVHEGETIIVIGQDPGTDYFNIMTPGGTIGWVGGCFFRDKRVFRPVQVA